MPRFLVFFVFVPSSGKNPRRYTVSAQCVLLLPVFSSSTFRRGQPFGWGEENENILQTLGVAAGFGGITALKFFTKPIVYLVILYMPVIAVHVEPFDKAISRRLRAWHIGALVMSIACFLQAIAGWAMSMGLPARAEGLAIWTM